MQPGWAKGQWSNGAMEQTHAPKKCLLNRVRLECVAQTLAKLALTKYWYAGLVIIPVDHSVSLFFAKVEAVFQGGK